MKARIELDQLEVRVAPRGTCAGETQVQALRKAITTELQNATEVAPNRVSVHTLEEMLDFLGMETQMKEQRYLDLRPQ